ncbi:MAG: nuclear transport factor 2 family protein [Bacteroidota bacterium]
MENTLGHQTFDDWLTRYGHAWEKGDADAVVNLFASDGRYYETPFDEPMVGSDAIRSYWQEGASDAQEEVTFSFTILSWDNNTGIAHWRAEFKRVPSGIHVDLDGILLAAFSPDGRCTLFKEWWHRTEAG